LHGCGRLVVVGDGVGQGACADAERGKTERKDRRRSESAAERGGDRCRCAALEAVRLVLVEQGPAPRADGHDRLRCGLRRLLRAIGPDRWLNLGRLIRLVVGQRHVIVAHRGSVSGIAIT
jgi:hypothetical protein